MALLVFALGCSSPPAVEIDGGTDAPAACPNVAGRWRFDLACPTGGGGFAAEVSQTACALTFVQTDDGTPMTWTARGPLAADGTFALSGELGFTTETTCVGAVTSSGAWSMTCGSCTANGARI